MWISIEGIDGAGKSTLISAIEEFLTSHQKSFIRTFEPGGGSEFCATLRQLILNPQHQLDEITELLLMLAARREHWLKTIVPNLEQGKYVVCDRFFDSTFAYQGFGRNMNLNMIELLSQYVHGTGSFTKPHLTFLLDLPVQISEERRLHRENQGNQNIIRDTFEKEELTFHERVREGFLHRANQEPERIKILDATQTPDVLKQKVFDILSL